MLFYAILYSDCIHSLSLVVRSNVDSRDYQGLDLTMLTLQILTLAWVLYTKSWAT